MKCPQHYLTDMQEVILFYNELDVLTRQILDSKGAIPSKTVADAKIALYEMAEYSQKWHNGTSSRTRSTETSDGLAAIQAQLNNLEREIKKTLVDLGASVSVMSFSTYTNLGLGILSHTRDKDEGKSHVGTFIDIPVFVGSVSIISGFTIIDDDDMTKDIVLSMKFCKNKEWNSGDDQLRLRWMIYLVVLADAAESVRDTIGFEYCLASSSGWTKSPVLWAEIGESSLTGPELVLDTTDKVVLIKEKLKVARDRQKSYADNRRKPLEFEVGDRVLLKVSPWKGVIRFGKRGKLAPRYVGPFEILERIGPVAYRLRLPEELSSVHDTFHVSNLKKCLADASLHVPLNEIKVDKTLRFVEEPVEIMDREIKKLKRSKIALVKVRWNSKRGSEFTWEREDHMKSKYPQLFVDHDVESAS
ncbi:putative reverse transcriptase domain-containing protein [Tanacetum coccineum]|uniref:Reverse transcriptase domain-containing protein n=1 Tax=Tanacetum coccineum TaxID=301880 RepID=A0ABQ4YH87_9ASTR